MQIFKISKQTQCVCGTKRTNKKGFERAQDLEFFGVCTRIEKPEDIIVAKIVYGSPIDIEDALAILMKQRENLDLKYLKRRAQEEGVRVELDGLMKKAKE